MTLAAGSRLGPYEILAPIGAGGNSSGAAGTTFWIDPVEEITCVFLTQLLPSSTHNIRPQLKQLVYQALTS